TDTNDIRIRVHEPTTSRSQPSAFLGNSMYIIGFARTVRPAAAGTAIIRMVLKAFFILLFSSARSFSAAAADTDGRTAVPSAVANVIGMNSTLRYCVDRMPYMLVASISLKPAAISLDLILTMSIACATYIIMEPSVIGTPSLMILMRMSFDDISEIGRPS